MRNLPILRRATHGLSVVLDSNANIAYLFHALSISEEIPDNNYESILRSLNDKTEEVSIDIEIKDTKANLQRAAKRELGKIEVTYPRFLELLQEESCEEAIVNSDYHLFAAMLSLWPWAQTH